MQFEPVIGLEIHLQLNSKAKLFCRAASKSVSEPNVNIDHYTFALPGTLPNLNWEPVEKALILALALSCQIQEVSYFDRKHYFYPDLPKGYQITQFYKPFAVLGVFKYPFQGRIKEVSIKSIQLEEDAGKSIHDRALNLSLIDLNRAGVPLVEVITDPCFNSAEEASEFVRFFRNLAKYLDISEANLEEGSLRVDANVSVRPATSLTLGTRVEIKNLNSYRFLTQAINFEIGRQIKEITEGREVVRETRGYNSGGNFTYSLRRKEELADYRYMPDPDLPPLRLPQSKILEVQSKLPILPMQTFDELVNNWMVPVEDAIAISYDRAFTRILREMIDLGVLPKIAVNYLVNDIQGILNEFNLESSKVVFPTPKIAELCRLYQEGKISSKTVKAYIRRLLLDDPRMNVIETIQAEGLLLEKVDRLDQVLEPILSELRELVDEIKNEPDKSKTHVKKKFGFLVGQVLRKMPNLDPRAVSEHLRQLVGLDEES